MNNWYLTFMSKERQKELTRLAEMERRAKACVESRPRRSRRYDRFLSWLGEHLERAGHKLKENHCKEPIPQ